MPPEGRGRRRLTATEADHERTLAYDVEVDLGSGEPRPAASFRWH